MGRKIAIMSAHESTLLAVISLLLSLRIMGTAVISLPLNLGIMGTAGLTSGQMLEMMAAMLFISFPLGWVMRLLWNSLLGLILLPCVYLGQRLIAEPIRRDTTGWIGGSAVAIVGSTGGLFQLGSMRASTAALSAGFVWMLAIQVVGGVLGIAAAQAGGYLGSMSALRRRRSRPEEAGTVGSPFGG